MQWSKKNACPFFATVLEGEPTHRQLCYAISDPLHFPHRNGTSLNLPDPKHAHHEQKQLLELGPSSYSIVPHLMLGGIYVDHWTDSVVQQSRRVRGVSRRGGDPRGCHKLRTDHKRKHLSKWAQAVEESAGKFGADGLLATPVRPTDV